MYLFSIWPLFNVFDEFVSYNQKKTKPDTESFYL